MAENNRPSAEAQGSAAAAPEDAARRYPLRIMPFFLMLYASNAVYQNYFTLYLREASFTEASVGLIMSISPLVAFVGQPLWGWMGDRVKLKRNLLFILCLVSAGVMLLMGMSQSFWYLCLMVGLYAFFQTSIPPIGDAITLEELENRGKPFGPIRMAGTVAFAVCSVIVGMLFSDSYSLMSPLMTGMLVALAVLSLLMPGVKGHMSRGRAVSPKVLLKNKELLLMLAHTMLLMLALSFFYTFFPVFFKEELGGTSAMLGWGFFISAISEVPFLIFADKLFKRFGVGKLLMAASVAMCTRWVLLFFIHDPYLALATQALHGGGFIVMSFSMAKYVSLVVPPELKATGQIVLNVVGLGVSRTLGSLIGGRIAAFAGIRSLFLIGAILATVAFVVFGLIMPRVMKKRAAA